jgi:hypothetical protein
MYLISSVITSKYTFRIYVTLYPTYVSAVVQPSSRYTSRFTSLSLVHLVFTRHHNVFVASVHFTLHMFLPWSSHHHGTPVGSPHCHWFIWYYHVITIFLYFCSLYPTHVSAVVQPSSRYTSRFTSLSPVHLVLSRHHNISVASVHCQMHAVFVLRQKLEV